MAAAAAASAAAASAAAVAAASTTKPKLWGSNSLSAGECSCLAASELLNAYFTLHKDPLGGASDGDVQHEPGDDDQSGLQLLPRSS